MKSKKNPFYSPLDSDGYLTRPAALKALAFIVFGAIAFIACLAGITYLVCGSPFTH
jgi:hypothetical protein